MQGHVHSDVDRVMSPIDMDDLLVAPALPPMPPEVLAEIVGIFRSARRRRLVDTAATIKG